MSIFNRKEENDMESKYLVESKYVGPEVPEKPLIPTGAKRALAAVALTGLLLGTGALGLYSSCQANDPTTHVCPITQLETKLFGYEKGLQHHYDDLVSHESDSYEVSDANYYVPATICVVPEGYILEGGYGVKYVEPTVVTTYSVPDGYILSGTIGYKADDPSVTIDAVAHTYYTLPNGGILTTDENGNKIGVMKVEPEEITVGARVSYTKTMGDGTTTYETWTYDGEAYTQEITEGPRLGLGR